MRQVDRMLPNEQLRRERQRRGWSREYVAEQIGIADPKTIGRWERGVAFPSPYSLQKLCTFFGMLAQDLGLFPVEHSNPPQADSDQQISYWNSTFAVSTSAAYDPAIPPPLIETDGLVGRDELLQQLKQSLCRGKMPAVSALNGLPGVGKTALARELVHDSDIQQHFCDGILWAGLGPRPNVSGLLGRWGNLLGIPTDEMALLKEEDERMEAIHASIGLRRMLLVIDDAWKSDDAIAFKVGGPNCAYLLTTRIPSVALHFANGKTIVVRELSSGDGLKLLARFAPDIITSEPESARALVQSVGGLPLALTLMGKYLQSQVYSGQPRRLRAALERLRHVEERLQLTMQRALFECLSDPPAHTPLSLQAVIETSTRQLDDATQHVLSLLPVFPAKPHSFSEEAALAVSAAPVELLDVLIDAGLLESAGPGRYTLHQTIADYANTRQGNAAAYERLVEYFTHYVQVHATDFDALEYEMSNVLAALQVAFERGWYALLLQGALPFSLFLLARGLYELAEIQLRRTGQAARSLGDLVSLDKVLYYQGEIAALRGETAIAEAPVQEDLTLAHHSGYNHSMGILLEKREGQKSERCVETASASIS